MSALRADVLGVGVWGPGLQGWAASRAVLAGEAPYAPVPAPAPPPTILPPTERRRAGPVVRLALAVAEEAAAASGLAPGSLRMVFGSSNGDGPVVGGILQAMAAAPGERVVSPTAFHNSVHNAAAGYWSIATGSTEPATCLGCHDSTWSAALLKAVADVAAEGRPVLLACYDHPLPPPLDALRPTVAPFAAGLVLGAPGGAGALARLEIRWGAGAGGGASLPREAALHELFHGNASARALPVLEGLARGGGRHVLGYLDGHLEVSVLPPLHSGEGRGRGDVAGAARPPHPGPLP